MVVATQVGQQQLKVHGKKKNTDNSKYFFKMEIKKYIFFWNSVLLNCLNVIFIILPTQVGELKQRYLFQGHTEIFRTSGKRNPEFLLFLTRSNEEMWKGKMHICLLKNKLSTGLSKLLRRLWVN